MALQTSGQISLNDVNVELGSSGTAQIGLGDTAVRDMFGVASGQISLSDGYGASSGMAQPVMGALQTSVAGNTFDSYGLLQPAKHPNGNVTITYRSGAVNRIATTTNHGTSWSSITPTGYAAWQSNLNRANGPNVDLGVNDYLIAGGIRTRRGSDYFVSGIDLNTGVSTDIKPAFDDGSYVTKWSPEPTTAGIYFGISTNSYWDGVSNQVVRKWNGVKGSLISYQNTGYPFTWYNSSTITPYINGNIIRIYGGETFNTYSGRQVMSTDGGSTWSLTSFFPSAPDGGWSDTQAGCMNPNDKTEVYISGRYGYHLPSYANRYRFWKTTGNGTSHTIISEDMFAYISNGSGLPAADNGIVGLGAMTMGGSDIIAIYAAVNLNASEASANGVASGSYNRLIMGQVGGVWYWFDVDNNTPPSTTKGGRAYPNSDGSKWIVFDSNGYRIITV